ncbi:MAG: hypothetical protein WD069_14030 [Planctomycetales bacterium]
MIVGYALGCYLAAPIPWLAGAPAWYVLFAPVTVPLTFVFVAMFIGNPEVPINGFPWLAFVAWMTLWTGGVGIVRIYERQTILIWPVVVVLAGYLLFGAAWITA